MPNLKPAIEVENLSRRFGVAAALNRISLRVQEGEYFSVLGPSGCGKTTLLRIIAGLDVADEGTVRIAGIDVKEVPAHRRPVNTVFQSYALFPHLSVWDNLAFGLRMKSLPGPEIERRVRQVMALAEIEPLGGRKPVELSGGQKQRVALARAIVNEPAVLLLDEPLGALDLKLRRQLQIELRQLQRRLGITFIHVTHDQDEAMVLSDRIAIMRDGDIEQIGDAKTLYESPRTRFVSQFLGSCSLLDAVVKRSSGNRLVVDTAIGQLEVSSKAGALEKITVAIRPEKLQLLQLSEGEGVNRVRAHVKQVVYVGAGTHYELSAGPHTLQAEAMNSQGGLPGFAPGQEAWAYFPPEALMVLDD